MTNTTYYFKYEPLRWRVLDPDAGFVLCESIIDSQPLQNIVQKRNDEYYIGSSSTYANNYSSSTLRPWLNDSFYYTAFNSAQKAKIKTSMINNDAYSADLPKFNFAATADPVFLLSYSEAAFVNYGLSSVAARKAKGTDYAKCQGLWVNTSSSGQGCSNWRLRSAGNNSNNASHIYYDGDPGVNAYVSGTIFGIRPACKLSDLTDNSTVSDV